MNVITQRNILSDKEINLFGAKSDNTAINPTVSLTTPLIFDALNNVSSAVMVFSPYKKVTENYTGYAVEVQRGSDLAVQDFGFDDNGDIDSAGILSFCGSGDGVVKKVYLQTQGTYASHGTYGNCPKIVSAGTFLSDGLLFDGTNDYFTIADYTAIQITAPTLNIYANFYVNTINDGFIFNRGSGGSYQYAINTTVSGTASRCYLEYTQLNGVINTTATNKVLLNWFGTGTNQYKFTVNGTTAQGTKATSASQPNIFVGCKYSGANHTNTQIKSIVVFNSDQSANLTAISNAI